MNAYAYMGELRYEIANPFDVRKISVDAHTGNKLSFPDRIYDSLSSARPETKSIGIYDEPFRRPHKRENSLSKSPACSPSFFSKRQPCCFARGSDSAPLAFPAR